MHLRQDSIPVGYVPTAAVASTPGRYTLSPGYTLSPSGYTLPPLGYPMPTSERTWYQGYPPSGKDVVPGIPYTPPSSPPQ